MNDFNLGIDLGIKELAVISNGTVYKNINKSDKMKSLERRKIHIQRSISRKYEQNKKGNKFVKTKNIEKQENKLRKITNHIKNIRDNYIHQTTHELVSLLPKKIIMEDLNVTGMMKNKHLSKAIQEQNFYKFISYMKYKCENRGIEFVQVDKLYPSSKKCSNCGNIKKNLKLRDRVYKCDCCNFTLDRDLNAAINLMNYCC